MLRFVAHTAVLLLACIEYYYNGGGGGVAITHLTVAS